MGLQGAFIVTAMFYAAGLVLVHLMYDERATHAQPADAPVTSRVTFRTVLAFQNFILMMGVIFGLQFVDRSFGPVLPLYVEQVGVTHARVPLVSGALFSIMAFTGALGHHFCGKLLRRYSSRMVISGGAALAAAGSGLLGLSGLFWVMVTASVLLGIGIGAAMTASFSAAGSVIPPGSHGAGFGVLTSASLVGMASSPFIAGLHGGTSIRIVFFVDIAMMALLAAVVYRTMTETVLGP